MTSTPLFIEQLVDDDDDMLTQINRDPDPGCAGRHVFMGNGSESHGHRQRNAVKFFVGLSERALIWLMRVAHRAASLTWCRSVCLPGVWREK
jgi:hypothetical protein